MNKKGMDLGILEIAIFVIIASVVISLVQANNDSVLNTNSRVSAFTASNTSCVNIVSESGKCIISEGTYANTSTSVGAGNFSLCNRVGTYSTGILLAGSDATELRYQGQSLNATFTEGSCSHVDNNFVVTLLPYIVVLLAVFVFMGVARWMSNK